MSSVQGWRLGAVAIVTLTGAIAAAAEPTDNPSMGIARSLAEISDIGGPADTSAPFSISPDGRYLAVVVRRGLPDINRYEQHILIVAVTSAAVERQIPLDGQPLFQIDARNYTNGTFKTPVPQWSEDGRHLYLCTDRSGTPQIIEVSVGSGEIRQITNLPGGVMDFTLDAARQRIILRYREQVNPDILRMEALEGFRYDDRWNPSLANRPLPPVPGILTADLSLKTLELSSTRGSNPNEIDDGRVAVAGDTTARIELADSRFVNSPVRVVSETTPHAKVVCPEDRCGGADTIWWSQDRLTLFVKRRTGWARSITEILTWQPSTRTFHTLLRTEDQVGRCRNAATEIICPIEGSRQPRQLVALDQLNGRRRVVLDPNPGWGGLTLGTVRRLQWRNRFGLEVIGDLVLPPGDLGGRKLPLLVVGYTTRGFLRGGTGDVVPIFALAARGFAVLTVERPLDIGMIEPARSGDEVVRRHFHEWRDRQSVDDAVRTGVDILVQKDIVDPARMGITGLSNGSENARYTLIHHPGLFRAAALFTCCDDPVALRSAFGPKMIREATQWGYPALDYTDRADARDYSLAANVRNIRTPLLLQISDREYLYSLETYAAYIEAKQCIDMYVFPDEYHIFWQPAHRLAVYKRTIAWFEFLLHERPVEPTLTTNSVDSEGARPAVCQKPS